MASLVDRVLARSPAQWFFSRRSAARLTVLAYHVVPDAATFRAHVDEICSYGTPVSQQDVLGHLTNGTQLPSWPVLVTFDDGRCSVLEKAAPVLADRGVPAVAFVNPGLAGTGKHYWWEVVAASAGTSAAAEIERLKGVSDSVRRSVVDTMGADRSLGSVDQHIALDALIDLERAGVAIGNHTHTHPILRNCDAATVRHEIEAAHEAIRDATGHAPRLFAYPDGAFDPRARHILDEIGCRAAFLFDHRQVRLPVHDRWSISRVRLNADDDPERVRIILSGLHPSIHRVRTHVPGSRVRR